MVSFSIHLSPWALWCYSQHPVLFHHMGIITSEMDVRHSDPLGPFLFCLVLLMIISGIGINPACNDLNFHYWYIDDCEGLSTRLCLFTGSIVDYWREQGLSHLFGGPLASPLLSTLLLCAFVFILESVYIMWVHLQIYIYIFWCRRIADRCSAAQYYAFDI